MSMINHTSCYTTTTACYGTGIARQDASQAFIHPGDLRSGYFTNRLEAEDRGVVSSSFHPQTFTVGQYVPWRGSPCSVHSDLSLSAGLRRISEIWAESSRIAILVVVINQFEED